MNLKLHYDKIKEQIETGKFNLVTDDQLAHLLEGQLLINTYCDRPWTELHIEEDGSVTPCCVMPSNRFPMGNNLKEYVSGEDLKELKTSLLSGIQHQKL